MSINFQEPVNLRKRCLETALKYTNQDRNESHGDPEDNFRNIAHFWNAHLSTRYTHAPMLDATDVALMMAGMKAARLAFNPTHEDSWIDMAGYAACGMDVALRHTTESLQCAEPETPWNEFDPKRMEGYSHDEILRQAAAWRAHVDGTEAPTFGDQEERLRARRAAAWRAHENATRDGNR